MHAATFLVVGESLAWQLPKSAGPIPTSLYGVAMTVDLLFYKVDLIFLKVDLSLQDSGPFFVRKVLLNLPNPLATCLLNTCNYYTNTLLSTHITWNVRHVELFIAQCMK